MINYIEEDKTKIYTSGSIIFTSLSIKSISRGNPVIFKIPLGIIKAVHLN